VTESVCSYIVDVCLQEILKALVARGPQFSEQEYANLLGLAYRSERGASDINLPQLCKRLEEILSEYDSIV